jgi:hypothetical protein
MILRNVWQSYATRMVLLERNFGLTKDRNKTIGDPFQIAAWVGFHFPGRGGKYSDMYWHWYHFTGVDWVNHFSLLLR